MNLGWKSRNPEYKCLYIRRPLLVCNNNIKYMIIIWEMLWDFYIQSFETLFINHKQKHDSMALWPVPDWRVPTICLKLHCFSISFQTWLIGRYDVTGLGFTFGMKNGKSSFIPSILNTAIFPRFHFINVITFFQSLRWTFY